MGTTPEPQPEEESEVQVFIHRAESFARILIAGHEVGAVRRIVLYAIVAVTLFAGDPVNLVGLAALMFLATTDVLR
jgi:hypothetical protein